MCAPGRGLSPTQRRPVRQRMGWAGHRVTVFGLYSAALPLTFAGVICRRALTSRIQMLRPCVAATISPAFGWTAISWTATVGRLLLIRVHEAPRSIEAYTENSVPR